MAKRQTAIKSPFPLLPLYARYAPPAEHLAKESLISPWTRQGIIRYWAYVNDVTAALKPFLGRWTIAGNIFSFMYSVVDTFIVARQVNKINHNQPLPQRRKHVAAHAVDAGVFQLLASVIVPYYLIDQIRERSEKNLLPWLSRQGLKALEKPAVKRYAPTLISLSAIPFTAPIIDKFFHWVMNNTLREWMDLPKLYHKKYAEQHIREQVKDSFDAFDW